MNLAFGLLEEEIYVEPQEVLSKGNKAKI